VFVTERGWRCKWCLLFVSPDAKVWIIRFQGLDGHGLGKEEEQRGVTGVRRCCECLVIRKVGLKMFVVFARGGGGVQ